MTYVLFAVGGITLFWWMGKRYLFEDRKPFRWAFAGLAYELFWHLTGLASASTPPVLRQVTLVLLVVLGAGTAWLYLRPGLWAVVYLVVVESLLLVSALLTWLLVTGNPLSLLPVATNGFVIGALAVGFLQLRRARRTA